MAQEFLTIQDSASGYTTATLHVGNVPMQCYPSSGTGQAYEFSEQRLAVSWSSLRSLRVVPNRTVRVAALPTRTPANDGGVSLGRWYEDSLAAIDGVRYAYYVRDRNRLLVTIVVDDFWGEERDAVYDALYEFRRQGGEEPLEFAVVPYDVDPVALGECPTATLIGGQRGI